MKKLLAIVLAALMLFTLVACGGKTAEPYAGTPAELVAKIYEAQPVELMLGEPVAIDLADADMVKMHLGLEDASNVKEAVLSQPMMGSQAYAMAIIRVNDMAKIEETKTAVFGGINPAKWVCVEADQIRVAAAGDMIVLVMVQSVLAEDLGTADLADKLVEAFTANVGELTGEILTK